MFSRRPTDKERSGPRNKGHGKAEPDTESLQDVFAVHTPQSTEDLPERRPRGRHRLLEIDPDSGSAV